MWYNLEKKRKLKELGKDIVSYKDFYINMQQDKRVI